jgi:MtN3 and saliva related transmembrane protein
MHMDYSSIIGHLAAFLTTVSFLPQAIKTIRSRETEQLSLVMYIMFVSGVILWTCYGVAIDSWPIIIGNVVTLLLSGTILVYKLLEK